jgi:hypothetical protein
LQSLNLDATHVSDAGLEALTGLGQLRTLDVRGTRVTTAGAARLCKALPALRVNR